ncbi:hypothetical protein ASPCADRAFT_212466 [Aspergillus carbonarius ITEM 5010]|uniref:Uncharacterized protein n=1 Tax=Aspergillus carbonarius (strain ITEM 5010) TaxID=602072 RepID=A0A1R3R5R0_ASPC5|nr:hypothetical protein ASPCADRAFT_212466 [Aspergillus carbonarius ITEM 5010]
MQPLGWDPGSSSEEDPLVHGHSGWAMRLGAGREKTTEARGATNKRWLQLQLVTGGVT